MIDTKIELALLSAKDSDEISRNIFKKAKQITLPNNTTVFQQGTNCQNYLLVLSGSVKVFTRSENGREIVLYRVQKDQSCILTTTCLMAQQSYPAEGVTESEVSAIIISAQDFNIGLAQSDYFRHLVFENYSKRLADVISLVAEVNFNRIDIRLAKFLINNEKNNNIEITHQELSVELGTAREVISRHLKILEKKQWIKIHRGKITIIDQLNLTNLAKTLVM